MSIDLGKGTVRWFGASWGAPVCEGATHIETPRGMTCLRCDGEIDSGDQGVTLPYWDGGPKVVRVGYHLDCWLGSMGIGPLAHEGCTHG